MKSFNNRFGGEPPGEPAWMREFANGFDPTQHKEEASWPVAGLAAYNAGRGKNMLAGLRAQSAKVTAGGIQSGLVRRSGKSPMRAPPKSGKEGGGCACGGEGGGRCKSRVGEALRGAPGSAERVRGRSSRLTNVAPSEAEELAAHASAVLERHGVRMGHAELLSRCRNAIRSVTSTHSDNPGVDLPGIRKGGQ